MGSYREIDGNLIELAKSGEFDVIAHGCNCHCTMGAGIALKMARAFNADEFYLEGDYFRGDVNKLGGIGYDYAYIQSGELFKPHLNTQKRRALEEEGCHRITIVNAYTQYGFGANHHDGTQIPLDYNALTLCMRKINTIFSGEHIGLPLIGCGLGGGDWTRVRKIIISELKYMKVTIVHYNN